MVNCGCGTERNVREWKGMEKSGKEWFVAYRNEEWNGARRNGREWEGMEWSGRNKKLLISKCRREWKRVERSGREWKTVGRSGIYI